MKYILLEISHRTIASYINRGDGTRTFQETSIVGASPLALCYTGGAYHTGIYALQQKESGNNQAFDNLFIEARNKSLKCQDIESKDFLPYVVKQTINQICQEEFYQDSTILRSELMIILLFGIDVNVGERNMLVDALLSEKYAKIEVADKAQRSALISLQLYNRDLNKNKTVLVISSDNRDLAVKCISTSTGATQLERLLLDKGKDPRFQFAIDQLWSGVERDTYSKKEKEMPYLIQALRSFLACNQLELTSIELSDGTYSCFLSRSMYDNYASNNALISTNFLSLLKSSKIAPEDCFVILENYAAGNKSFKDALSNFSPIIDEDKNLREELRNMLLRDILDGRPVTYYNILPEDKDPNPCSPNEPEPEPQVCTPKPTPTVIGPENQNVPPLNQQYDEARKFIINVDVKTSRSGFFSKKKTFSIEISIVENKNLPCDCALTIDEKNYKSFHEENLVEEMKKGTTGPFLFGPYEMPLAGINKDAKIIYAHIYPRDRKFSPNLFRNNHVEIKF